MSRRKLENFVNYFKSNRGIKPASLKRGSLEVSPDMVISKRESQTRLGGLPDNPFMVPTVIEDLKTRWNKNAILELVPSALGILQSRDLYPWENITQLVPGEADIYCANAAKQCEAAVLTGDSDLLVHNIGLNGRVIFFNTIESHEGDTEDDLVKIRAAALYPNKIARKLGVRSIQRFAFELKRDPYMNLGKIIQRAKDNAGGVENNAAYLSFLREYASVEGSEIQENDIQGLDPKVSELYVQYTHAEFGVGDQPPVTYLPMLVEDHSRRCAWQEGIEIRTIACSIMNMKFSPKDRKNTVLEYSRRGTRVFPTPLDLLKEEDLHHSVSTLYSRLSTIMNGYGDSTVLGWKSFAIQQILCGINEDNWPTPDQLLKLIEAGRCAKTLSWSDIHFNAQIQSILYSLRILQQSMAVSRSHGMSFSTPTFELLRQLLQTLPPMRVISHSLSDVMVGAPTISKSSIRNAVSALLATFVDGAEDHSSDENNSTMQST